MSFSQTHTLSVKADNNDPEISDITQSGGARADLQEAIPASSSNMLMNWAVKYANVKALMILSSIDCTLETNNSGSPDETLTLKANIPYDWIVGKPQALAITHDVTKIYITTASEVDGLLTINCLYDPTP